MKKTIEGKKKKNLPHIISSVLSLLSLLMLLELLLLLMMLLLKMVHVVGVVVVIVIVVQKHGWIHEVALLLWLIRLELRLPIVDHGHVDPPNHGARHGASCSSRERGHHVIASRAYPANAPHASNNAAHATCT